MRPRLPGNGSGYFRGPCVELWWANGCPLPKSSVATGAGWVANHLPRAAASESRAGALRLRRRSLARRRHWLPRRATILGVRQPACSAVRARPRVLS